LSSQGVTGVLWLVALAAIGYFLLIRPTRRRAQEVRALQNALAVGAEVILTSGIFGTVIAIADERIRVEIAEGVIVEVHRGAIGKILMPANPPDGDPDSDPDGDIESDDADHSTADDSARDSGSGAGQDPRGVN
jgi:preprotein translocase subunit YajC